MQSRLCLTSPSALPRQVLLPYGYEYIVIDEFWYPSGARPGPGAASLLRCSAVGSPGLRAPAVLVGGSARSHPISLPPCRCRDARLHRPVRPRHAQRDRVAERCRRQGLQATGRLDQEPRPQAWHPRTSVLAAGGGLVAATPVHARSGQPLAPTAATTTTVPFVTAHRR